MMRPCRCRPAMTMRGCQVAAVVVAAVTIVLPDCLSVAASSGPDAVVPVPSAQPQLRAADAWAAPAAVAPAHNNTSPPTWVLTPAPHWEGRSHAVSVLMGEELFVMGGIGALGDFRDVWKTTRHSTQHWVLVTLRASWSARARSALAVVDDPSSDGQLMLLIGGTSSAHLERQYMSDVWISSDGAQWTCVLQLAPFGKRSTTAITHKGIVFVLGGTSYDGGLNDVWRSTDDLSDWQQVTESAGWAKRSQMNAVSFHDNIYIAGGMDPGSATAFNDVWFSSKGDLWYEATPARGAAWAPRSGFALAVFPPDSAGAPSDDETMVLLGGMNFLNPSCFTLNCSCFNDVWETRDGRNWTRQVTTDATAPWYARSGANAHVFNGNLVLFGGQRDCSSDMLHDQWVLTPDYVPPRGPDEDGIDQLLLIMLGAFFVLMGLMFGGNELVRRRKRKRAYNKASKELADSLVSETAPLMREASNFGETADAYLTRDMPFDSWDSGGSGRRLLDLVDDYKDKGGYVPPSVVGARAHGSSVPKLPPHRRMDSGLDTIADEHDDDDDQTRKTSLEGISGVELSTTSLPKVTSHQAGVASSDGTYGVIDASAIDSGGTAAAALGVSGAGPPPQHVALMRNESEGSEYGAVGDDGGAGGGGAGGGVAGAPGARVVRASSASSEYGAAAVESVSGLGGALVDAARLQRAASVGSEYGTADIGAADLTGATAGASASVSATVGAAAARGSRSSSAASYASAAAGGDWTAAELAYQQLIAPDSELDSGAFDGVISDDNFVFGARGPGAEVSPLAAGPVAGAGAGALTIAGAAVVEAAESEYGIASQDSFKTRAEVVAAAADADAASGAPAEPPESDYGLAVHESIKRPAEGAGGAVADAPPAVAVPAATTAAAGGGDGGDGNEYSDFSAVPSNAPVRPPGGATDVTGYATASAAGVISPTSAGSRDGGGAGSEASSNAGTPLARRESTSERYGHAKSAIKVLKYESLRVDKDMVGSGNFGSVYRGRYHGAACAVKRLHDEEMDRDQLLEEAAVLSHVSGHPHVLTFYGVTLAPCSIVSEFATRGSVDELLSNTSRKVGLRDIVRMAWEASTGVLHLHEEGVVHRDIAARNLLLDEGWHVKVSDFGLSRALTGVAVEALHSRGPLRWWPPELIKQSSGMSSYSRKSDVYMFSITMWEMLCRRKPYSDIKKPEKAAFKVALEGMRPQVPKQLARVAGPYVEVMKRCWAHSPRDRPSMEDVEARLRAYSDKLEMEHIGVVEARRRSSSVASAVARSQGAASSDSGSGGGSFAERRKRWFQRKPKSAR